MGLFRLFPTADAWITNKIVDDTTVRATGSNLGSSPMLQVFKVTGSYPSSGVELARSLLQFDISYLSGCVFNDKTIPASGVSYFLKAFNYVLDIPSPASFDLFVWPLSSSWDEGVGQDDLNFRDYGYVNWFSRTSVSAWNNTGSDYLTTFSASQHFDHGAENIEVNVTSIVSAWLTGTLAPNGFLIKLGATEENNGNDYYRKVFYSQETNTVEKLPYLEARWDDSRKDNRANFAFNQPNSLFLYNFIRGSLQDLSGSVSVRLQDNWAATSSSFSGIYSTNRLETGIYAAPIQISNAGQQYSASWIDIWTDVNNTLLLTGSFSPLILTGSDVDPYAHFIIGTNIKPVYSIDEVARICVNVRKKDYSDQLAIHTASLAHRTEYVENMYYSVINNDSNETIVPFFTGSIPATKLSYNKDGNYFNLWMNAFVPGFTYRFVFMILFNKYERDIIDNKYLFKVF